MIFSILFNGLEYRQISTTLHIKTSTCMIAIQKMKYHFTADTGRNSLYPNLTNKAN